MVKVSPAPVGSTSFAGRGGILVSSTAPVGLLLEHRGACLVFGHHHHGDKMEDRRQPRPVRIEILQREDERVQVRQDLFGAFPALAVDAAVGIPAAHPALRHRRYDRFGREDGGYLRGDLVGDGAQQRNARAAHRRRNILPPRSSAPACSNTGCALGACRYWQNRSTWRWGGGSAPSAAAAPRNRCRPAA